VQLQDSIDFEREQAFYLEKIQQQQEEKLNKEDYDILLALRDRYQFIAQAAQFSIFPSLQQKDWQTMGEALLGYTQSKRGPSTLLEWGKLSTAFRDRSPDRFNTALQVIVDTEQELLSKKEQSRLYWEGVLLKVQPFLWCIILYVALFITGVSSKLFLKKILYSCSWSLGLVALALHSFGLFARMYVQARPPVTSLYSSAVFIGWIAVIMFFIIELRQRNALSLIGAALVGGTTQVIAHHLAQSGDSIEVMRAVLDSNFWLATHVVVITIGYSCTYVAGFLANAYLFRRIFIKRWTKKSITEAAQQVYMVTGFSTLMSFTGTVLGGIWADQSWGRFWGWDPKENGALLIVLWCAVLLHLRLARMVSEHVFLCLAALSTIVTSFSWFGVNLLGIGLHSYGFTEGTFAWLAGFIACQVLFVLLVGVSKRKHLV
jgi:ABC-type transport system involved in cytochrome c biogenesis permease subunit